MQPRKNTWNSSILLFIFLFTLLSGAVRKWGNIPASISMLITVAQIFIVYLTVFTRPGNNGLIEYKFHKPAILYILYSFAAAFYPAVPTIFHGLTGIIVHSGFWLGLFIYLSNRGSFDLVKYWPLILALCIGEAALGIAQYQLPFDHWLNYHASDYDEETLSDDSITITVVGEAIRIAGTFSYIAGFGAFVLFFELFTFSLFLEKKIESVIFVFLSVLGALLALMSGYRAIVLIYTVVYIMFFITCVNPTEKQRIFKFSVLGLMIAGILASFSHNVMGISALIDDAFHNFNVRVESSEDEGIGRILEPFDLILNRSIPNPVFGNGLGITYQGIARIFGTTELSEKFQMENEVGKNLLEGGYLLLILKITFIVFAVKYLSLPRLFTATLLILVFLYASLSGSSYNTVFVLLGIISLDTAYDRRKTTAGI